MRRLGTYEGTAENGDITWPEDEDASDKTGTYVLLPDLDPERTYKVMSPRLAHSEQAKDFVQVVIEETPDTS